MDDLGLLVYRILRHAQKKTLKIAHTVTMAVAFCFAIISVNPVLDELHFYTVHAWIGFVAFALFTLQVRKIFMFITLSVLFFTDVFLIEEIYNFLFHFQWFAGLITYLFPGLDSSIKKSYMPIHIFFGILIFILISAACLTGIMEKLILSFE